MDIGSKAGYPASALSNFSPHPFVIDGVQCVSMEGFLQSLKFSNPQMQEHVCTLVGMAAKRKGAKKNWKRTQTLYWRDAEIDRHGEAYQHLLDRAYEAMAAQSAGFRKALLASGDATLTHSRGERDAKQTVLTVREFCSRLVALRERVRAGEWDEEGKK